MSQSQAAELCAQVGIMFLSVYWDRPIFVAWATASLSHEITGKDLHSTTGGIFGTTEHRVAEIYSEINCEPITGDRTLRTSGNHVLIRTLGQKFLAWALSGGKTGEALCGTKGHRVAEIQSEINCEPITGDRTLRTSGNHVFIRTLRQVDICRKGYCVLESGNNFRRFA